MAQPVPTQVQQALMTGSVAVDLVPKGAVRNRLHI
jgi:hypothetical protein